MKGNIHHNSKNRERLDHNNQHLQNDCLTELYSVIKLNILQNNNIYVLV